METKWNKPIQTQRPIQDLYSQRGILHDPGVHSNAKLVMYSNKRCQKLRWKNSKMSEQNLPISEARCIKATKTIQ